MVKSKRISPGRYRYSCGESLVDVVYRDGKWVATYDERATKPQSFSAEFLTLNSARTWAHDTLAEYA